MGAHVHNLEVDIASSPACILAYIVLLCSAYSQSFNMASAISLAERTFIVTGANSGLGFETARALARQDAHVIFAVKTKEKGDEAIRKIQQEDASKRAKLECRQVDLASFRYTERTHKLDHCPDNSA